MHNEEVSMLNAFSLKSILNIGTCIFNGITSCLFLIKKTHSKIILTLDKIDNLPNLSVKIPQR